MNYSKAIRIARSIADISQGQLADKAAIDRSYLSLIESGKRQPSTEVIEKIAKALVIPFHLLSLLGSEESDVKQTSQEHIASLSVALTKLLLEAPSVETEIKQSGPKKRSRPSVGKSPRSRTPARREPGSFARARKQLAGGVQAVSATA
jgi:transcriptional regulator with XRE-family HTH domain